MEHARLLPNAITFLFCIGTQFHDFLQLVMTYDPSFSSFLFFFWVLKNVRNLANSMTLCNWSCFFKSRTRNPLLFFLSFGLATPTKMSKSAEWIISWYTSQLLLFLLLCSFVEAANNSKNTTTPSESLDVILHKHAFKALVHRRPLTGALYEAPLPVDLAGIQVTVVRLRSRTLWRKGANFSNFRIPSRTLPTPYVRRLFLVYQDLGNLSSHYYNISGYSLVSSVVGFTVYDASTFSINNIKKLDLSTAGTQKQISIQFPNLTFESGTAPRTSCAIFGADGRVSLSETSLGNVCYSRSPGHFSIVAPWKTEDKARETWAIGFVLGFIFLVCAGFVGIIYVKLFKEKKMHEMEREAHEGVVLDTVWIHNSKMPSATVTRTHPTLENADFP